MTRKEVKEILPIMQAYAEGKTIQFLKDDKWHNVYDIGFYEPAYKYRIKPEEKYKSFKTKEECWNKIFKHQPFGWIINKSHKYFYLIDFI